MPKYEILDEVTGEVVTIIESDTPPTDEDMEYIAAQKRKENATPNTVPTPVDELQSTGVQRAIDVGMEFVTGADRPFASLVDFLTTPLRVAEQQIRPYAQAMLGIRDFPDSPQAAFRSTTPFSLRSMVAEKGEFAGEDAATDIAAGAGEFTGLVMSINPIQRLFSQAIALGLETGVAKNVFQVLGSGKPIDDIVFGFTGGLGGEAAASQFDTPEYKELARMTGQIITPAMTSTLVNKVIDYSASNLLGESVPDKKALKGAANYLYEQVKDVRLTKGEAARLSNNIRNFFDDEITNDQMYGTIRNRLTNVLKSIEEGKVDFKTLDTARSKLMQQASGTDEIARAAGAAAKVLDDAILQLEATAPADIGNGRTTADVINTARNLWRRQSTVGQLEEIVETTTRKLKADGGKAAPFATQLRKEMAKLLNSKKKSLFFTKEEKRAIDDFIDGKPIYNFLEKIGSVAGIAERLSLGTIMSSLGAFAVTTQNPSLALPSLAVAGVAAGGMTIIEGARQVALNALKRSGTLMKTSISLGGADGLTVAKSYMANTPKDLRKPQELAAILISNNMDMTAFRESALASSDFGKTIRAYYDLFRRGIAEQSNQTEQTTPTQ